MIPFLDLRAQYRSIQDELEEAVLSTLRSCNYILGEPVECFEENFARYCGTEHAVAAELRHLGAAPGAPRGRNRAG